VYDLCVHCALCFSKNARFKRKTFHFSLDSVIGRFLYEKPFMRNVMKRCLLPTTYLNMATN